MSAFEFVLYLCDIYTAFNGGRIYETTGSLWEVQFYQWVTYTLLFSALIFGDTHETFYQYLFIFCTLVTMGADMYY